MGDTHRSLAVLPKRDEFRADRTLDGLLKVWLKHLPKPEYDNLTDEYLDDDLSEPPFLYYNIWLVAIERARRAI